MTAIDKASMFISTFPSPYHTLVTDRGYQLDINGDKKRRYLSDEEKHLLTLLGAINVFAYESEGLRGLMVYTGNLDTYCCGDASFKFSDDEDGVETLPLPVYELVIA